VALLDGRMAGVHTKVQALRQKFVERDQNHEMVSWVREGKIHYLMPEIFSEEIPRSVVANTIDTVARDLAEVMAPLPTLDCSAGNGITNADKKRAERKNRIGMSYWDVSRLATAMFKFADYYNSYGVAAFCVEADFDRRMPTMRVEDPRGLYYRLDRWGRPVEVAKVWQALVGDLIALYPEHAAILRGSGNETRADDHLIEMVRYSDKQGTVVYLPECNHLAVARASHILGKIPVVIVERPGIGSIPRGQFDDVMWVQLARAIMAQYTLSAADKSINAPIAGPRDVTNFPIGPDAYLATDNPQGVGRVRLDVPRDVLLYGEQLDREVNKASRYPEARDGGVKGNIITGRGVEALMGTFDTQLKTAQDLFKIALQEGTSLCFELDAKLWPNARKTINGVQTGRPFEMTYVPSRDIGENYSCEVTYGFAAGMTPAQSMVALLQLRGDKLIGRDTARAQMPFPLDTEKEQRDVDEQDLNDALMQGMMATAQALPALATQGMSPGPIVTAIAAVIEARQKGTSLHEAVTKAFTPPEPQQQAPEDQLLQPEPQAAVGSEPAGGELPPGMNATGRMLGVAPGQQGMPPGGMGAIQSLISGFRGENLDPRMSAETLRKRGLGVG
jgi:hypothetical protein